MSIGEVVVVILLLGVYFLDLFLTVYNDMCKDVYGSKKL